MCEWGMAFPCRNWTQLGSEAATTEGRRWKRTERKHRERSQKSHLSQRDMNRQMRTRRETLRKSRPVWPCLRCQEALLEGSGLCPVTRGSGSAGLGWNPGISVSSKYPRWFWCRHCTNHILRNTNLEGKSSISGKQYANTLLSRKNASLWL